MYRLPGRCAAAGVAPTPPAAGGVAWRLAGAQWGAGCGRSGRGVHVGARKGSWSQRCSDVPGWPRPGNPHHAGAGRHRRAPFSFGSHCIMLSRARLCSGHVAPQRRTPWGPPSQQQHLNPVQTGGAAPAARCAPPGGVPKAAEPCNVAASEQQRTCCWHLLRPGAADRLQENLAVAWFCAGPCTASLSRWPLTNFRDRQTCTRLGHCGLSPGALRIWH